MAEAAEMAAKELKEEQDKANAELAAKQLEEQKVAEQKALDDAAELKAKQDEEDAKMAKMQEEAAAQ